MCLNPGDILRDRYQIIDLLGEGGFAITYRAISLKEPGNPLCVVKEIKPPDSRDPQVLQYVQEQFTREVRTLERLGQHDRIPRFFEGFQERTCYRERENFYVILEYIEGAPLDEEVTSNTRWDETQVVEFLRNILSVIEFIHKNNVIHRDIKPSNLIRRTSDNQIVPIDFGSVKEISSLEITESGQTRTRTTYTPGYTSPEQMHGNPQLCSDIYSIGITAIQAITGLRPDRDVLLHPGGYTVWHYSIPGRQIAEISCQLQTILNKMVSYDFADRYQSAAEVLQDLNQLTSPNLQPSPPQLVALTTATPHQSAGELSPDLEQLSIAPAISAISETIEIATSHSSLKDQQFFRYLFNRLLRAVVATVAGLATPILLRMIQPPTCPLIQGDALSCGEEILFTSSDWFKRQGVEGFAASNPQQALEKFKESWNKAPGGKDPETLVYMNNAFLEANKIPYYTIAVALPIGSRNPDSPNHMSDRAKEVLRGVAQAQTEVNLGLAKSKGDRDFPGQGFLKGNAINGKGLKVVIADDTNNEKEAEKIASLLVKQPDILAVVGHTNSEMTMAAVDVYDRNNLVSISPGASTEELTSEPKKFFFRTQYTSSLIAKSLADHLLANNQKQATIIYNPSNPFSTSFNEEFTRYFRDIKKGKIVRIRDFDLSKKDFNAQRAIKEIQGKGKTAIALVPDAQVTTSLNNAVEILKLNADRNWIVGAWTLMRSGTLELASQQPQKSFKKLILSVGWHPLNSQNKEFPQQARSLWGGEVNTRTASAYDAARALIKALEMQDNPSREGMQKTLSDPNFSAEGATGTIQFNSPDSGDRKNPPSDLVHIVECPKEQFGLVFVPVKYPTAAAAGLKCD